MTKQRPLTPREWIARALHGFFRREGASLSDAQKKALMLQMAVAVLGIEGEVDLAQVGAAIEAALAGKGAAGGGRCVPSP